MKKMKDKLSKNKLAKHAICYREKCVLNIKDDGGSALIEFALIVPLLIIFIAGIIEFGFILNAKIVVNSASYEGAKAASLGKEPKNEAIGAVLNYVSSNMPGWSYEERLKTDVICEGIMPGDLVTVKVSYNIPLFFRKIIPYFNDDSFSITGESTVQIEEKE
jgi:hypothetical protein